MCVCVCACACAANVKDFDLIPLLASFGPLSSGSVLPVSNLLYTGGLLDLSTAAVFYYITVWLISNSCHRKFCCYFCSLFFSSSSLYFLSLFFLIPFLQHFPFYLSLPQPLFSLRYNMQITAVWSLLNFNHYVFIRKVMYVRSSVCGTRLS